MPTTWYSAEIIALETLTPRVRRCLLRLPADTPFTFQPGQFVTLDLPTGEKRLDRWRSYSIASPPGPDPVLELLIGQIPGGRASDFFFEQARIGQVLPLKGPEGTFVLPAALSKELVWVCTGTGLAPFCSMLLHLDREDRWPDARIHLIYGSRTGEDLLYADTWLELARRRPGFRFTAALSRLEPNAAAPWMHSGRVHEVYRQHYPDPHPDRQFWLCGWSAMIDEALRILTEDLGYDSRQLIHERYG